LTSDQSAIQSWAGMHWSLVAMTASATILDALRAYVVSDMSAPK
jgi:hypothetical protein